MPTDWFAIRKVKTQSYAEAIEEGHLGTKVKNEFKMFAMDVDNILWIDFLNGKVESQLSQFKNR
jgi:hypothetical protein